MVRDGLKRLDLKEELSKDMLTFYENRTGFSVLPADLFTVIEPKK